MERRKNIIFITGKDLHKVQNETERFIEAFRNRQDANAIDMYRVEEIRDWWAIMQAIQTLGLFVEKRLFVFTGVIPAKKLKDDTDEEKTKKKWADIESSLIEVCENAGDDTFIILSQIDLSAKSPLRKWLEENADVRKFENIWDIPSWKMRFPSLEESDIRVVIEKYRSSLTVLEIYEKDAREKTLSYALSESLEKLSLIWESRNLEISDYEDSIVLEASWKIFDFTDALLRGDSLRAISIFHTLLEGMSIHAFIPSLIGLMRASIYAKHLRTLGYTPGEITKNLWIHAFVVQKACESRILYKDLFIFYDKILSLNIAYRSGKWRKDPELWRIFDIDLAIMGLKK